MQSYIRFTIGCTIFLLFSCLTALAQTELKDIADTKKVFIGNIISNEHLDDPSTFRNGLADNHLREQYNAVVLENYMKMAFILPSSEPSNIHDLTVDELRNLLADDKIEAFLTDPNWTDMRKRGHAMIWFNQAPQWLNLAGPTWTGQQVFSFARKYILALGQICGNRVDEWDVINEAISDTAPDGERIWRERTWYRRANDGSTTDWGEATYENFIKMLFVWAREAQPEARLHINDYGIEQFNSSLASKNRFMRDQVKALKACGAPIDGVGFQSHFTLSNMVSADGTLNADFISSIEQTMQDLAAEGLEVAITELDIRICDDDREEAFQETAFQAYCQMALAQPNCHEVLIWGLRDEDNWITLRNDQFFAGCEDAVIAEGDEYSKKPAYDGVYSALNALPDQDDYSFAPINPGNGSPADCGGIGSVIADILQVSGPSAVFPGDQPTVSIWYLASADQEVVVWFQLDSGSYTVYSQSIIDVSAGSGIINVDIDIPLDVASGVNRYRYYAYIRPDGSDYDGRINEQFQNRITVLGEDSQLIISSFGPESVSPGDTANIIVEYSAIENQEIVVWFQLDHPPYTTYQEFRQVAEVGQHNMEAKLIIPSTVPIENDAYQYQTLLVPMGGSWPDRIFNLTQQDVDVLMNSSTAENENKALDITLFPNPTTGRSILEMARSTEETNISVYNSVGQSLERRILPPGEHKMALDLHEWNRGIYFICLQQAASNKTIKLVKQ